MSTRKMNLSSTGKEILDHLRDTLEVERPTAIKIALARGIASSVPEVRNLDYSDEKPKWSVPDVIRGEEYTLFKQLIINETQKPVTEPELQDLMLSYLEYGLRIIQEEINSLTSLDDYRATVLGH